jgi:hypothetical protein
MIIYICVLFYKFSIFAGIYLGENIILLMISFESILQNYFSLHSFSVEFNDGVSLS